MQLSIVSTLYQSSPYLEEFIQRMCNTALQITEDFELILVNDGSPDDALSKALHAQKQEQRIKIIDLSRNFGHHEAGMVGLQHTQGDYTLLIDCDLEEAPELLLDFWQDFHALQDVDMLYGVQPQRQGNWFKKISGTIYYQLFNCISDLKIEPNATTLRLMKKCYVDTLTQYQERNLFFAGIMAHAGFKQQAKQVNKSAKTQSTYTLLRRLKLFFASIVGFSNKPLSFLLHLGNTLLLLALLYGIVLSWTYHFEIASIPVNNIIILATQLILSCILICSGTLGLYLANMSTEVKQRPRAIIKHIYQTQQ